MERALLTISSLLCAGQRLLVLCGPVSIRLKRGHSASRETGWRFLESRECRALARARSFTGHINRLLPKPADAARRERSSRAELSRSRSNQIVARRVAGH